MRHRVEFCRRDAGDVDIHRKEITAPRVIDRKRRRAAVRAGLEQPADAAAVEGDGAVVEHCQSLYAVVLTYGIQCVLKSRRPDVEYGDHVCATVRGCPGSGEQRLGILRCGRGY